MNDGYNSRLKTPTNNTVPGVGKPDISGGAVLGNIIPNSALVGADIKNDYSYERDIAPNNTYGKGDSGDSGAGGGSVSGSGVKKVTVSSGGGGRGGISSSLNETPVQTVPDTTVQDAYKAQMDAANERLKQAYEFQQAQLQNAKDDAFREAYIKQQMVERAYPEQLAAAGIRGGAAQGVIARNNADYAKQRTAIHNNYLGGLAQAGQTYQQGVLGANEDYLRSMAAYEQALKQMAIQHQYDKELAMLKASLG